jgi:hypothetical protein
VTLHIPLLLENRMSRLLASTLSIAVLMGVAPRVKGAEDDPREIIAKAIKAHGGEEFLTKYKAAKLKSKGKINIPGAGEFEFTQDTAYMLPDKYRDGLDLTIMGMNIAVRTYVNGDKVTLEVNDKEVDMADKVKAAIKDVGHVQDVARMVTLRDKAYEVSLIGEDKVEGKKVVGIRVSKKGQKDVSLFFDKETNLLTKLEYRGAEPGTDNEVNEERIVKEYEKNSDGIPLAKKIVVKHDGKQFLEAEVLEVKHFEKLDDSEFKK